MSEQPKLKNRPTDQPLPVGGSECVQDALVAEILARKAIGEQSYGSPLMTFNGRSAVRDAREEALDLAVYLMQIEMEVDEMHQVLQRIDNAIALGCQDPEPSTVAQHGFYAAMNLIRLARHPKASPTPTDIEDHVKEQIFTQVPFVGEEFVQALYDEVFAPMAATMESLQQQVAQLCENRGEVDPTVCAGCGSPDVVYTNFLGTRLCGMCSASSLPV